MAVIRVIVLAVIRAVIRLFGLLCVVLAALLGLFALFGFIVSDDTSGRVVAGVLGGLALLLAMIGVRALRHRGPRDLTLSPRANSPSISTTANRPVVGRTFLREADLENFLVRNWDRLDFGTPWSSSRSRFGAVISASSMCWHATGSRATMSWLNSRRDRPTMSCSASFHGTWAESNGTVRRLRV